MHVLYYITAHGYGHGVRATAIANKISRSIKITFRTNLPRSFFCEEMSREFDYYNGYFDCGCLQKDSVTVDIKATLDRYKEIALRNATLLESETFWCREQAVDLIVSDVTPFAFEVAHNASIPAIAISNFTWYDIYYEYLDRYPQYRGMVDGMREQYETATCILALSPALEMRYMAKKFTIDLVARAGNRIKSQICHHFNVDPSKKLGLIYAGDFGLENVAWEKLSRFHQWEFLGVYPLENAPSNYHLVTKNEFRYQDLTASADLMITKLGYGAVSECFVHGTPLLYLPREDFAEYPVLEGAVKKWGGGVCLTQEEFYSLKWDYVLENLPSPPNSEFSGGERQCARIIEDLLNT